MTDELNLVVFEHKAWDETDSPYPIEGWGRNEDDGVMLENMRALQQEVVGERIVKAEIVGPADDAPWYKKQKRFEITLSSGKKVFLRDTNDCCAFTELHAFLLHPESVNHVIMGVGTTEGYTKWHIFADFGDIMALTVDWSCGNPFYYVYGFEIKVEEQS